MTDAVKKPLLLIILDGWGYREAESYNAISNAQKPYWEQLWQTCPHTLLHGSGVQVGLPAGQMGNSEVGHLNIGAGRIVYQDLVRIDNAIKKGDFAKNPVLLQTILATLKSGKALHILGLVSPGGVHSHELHIHALIELAASLGLKRVYLHAFLDGRDTPPKSASPSLQALQEKFAALNCGQIASVIGRYYAMDRDQRWERTAMAYQLLTQNNILYKATSADEALNMAYARGETDEFVQATQIGNFNSRIQLGDSVIFMNFRADRARQLSYALNLTNFSHFPRSIFPKLNYFTTLTHYANDLPAKIAFNPIVIKRGLGEYLSQQGLKQLRIAETEKYAHVTFFFNGGQETPYPGEERILIASPKVATYDIQPQMSAAQVTEQIIAAIKDKYFDLIVCNYANPDMVGHSGNYKASIQAIETIDLCLGRIKNALDSYGGEAIITADHGNAEVMYDCLTAQPHTAHTCALVPFLYMGPRLFQCKASGNLADIAPSLLELLGLPQPSEMTGSSLFIHA